MKRFLLLFNSMTRLSTSFLVALSVAFGGGCGDKGSLKEDSISKGQDTHDAWRIAAPFLVDEILQKAKASRFNEASATPPEAANQFVYFDHVTLSGVADTGSDI